MTKQTFNSIALLILFAVFSLCVAMNLGTIGTMLSILLSVLMPFFLGLTIAFVLNRPYRGLLQLYQKVLPPKGRWARIARPLAVLTVYAVFFGVIVLIFAVLIPEVVYSAQTLIGNLESYMSNMQWFYTWATEQLHIEGVNQGDVLAFLQQFYENLMQSAGGAIPIVFSWTQSVVQVVINLFLGFTTSIYMLLDKDHLISIVHRMLHAYLPNRVSRKVEGVAGIANEVFAGFVSGQVTEAFILGFMCFAGMTICGFPYALLISVIIGFTNFIPYLGPFLGTVPGAIILFMVRPIQAVWFIIMVIVIQQIDNNFVYPRVVGSQVGLPALWVLVAVVGGGSLFGLTGMVLGVPCVSVVYRLLKNDTARRLEEKEERARGAEKHRRPALQQDDSNSATQHGENEKS